MRRFVYGLEKKGSASKISREQGLERNPSHSTKGVPESAWSSKARTVVDHDDPRELL